MRGAVIPISVRKGIPTTFTLRRGIQSHAFFISIPLSGTVEGRWKNSHEKESYLIIMRNLVMRNYNQSPKQPSVTCDRQHE